MSTSIFIYRRTPDVDTNTDEEEYFFITVYT